MRQDMYRVVNQGGNAHKFHPFMGRTVQQFRTGGRDDFEPQDYGFYPQAVDVEPVEVGRAKMRVTGSRHGGDNVTFAPLRRWLASQVGRRWSEVYAEMSAKYVPAMGRSLREWLAGEVAIDCYRSEDGTLLVNTTYRGVQEAGAWSDFYVDPDTGLLCKSARNWGRTRWKDQLARREAERAKVFRKGEGDIQYHKRDGIWYEVRVASFSKAEQASPERYGYKEPVFDSFLKSERRAWHGEQARELYGERDLYAVSHRALGRRDAAKLALD